MTAIVATDHPTTTTDRSTASTTATTTVPSWRAGAVVAVGAAAAATGVAAVAHAAGVSFETAPGEAIPMAGFAQLALFFTVVGVVLARTLGRRARTPRSTFVRTTVALTALSFVPDLALSAAAGTKVALMLTHLAAAAVAIPALAGRLADRRP